MQLYAIGYAGRDREKTLEHIEELKEIGVPEPKEVPELYHLNPKLLSESDEMYVIGNNSSGEVEVVLVYDESGQISVTVGSDHTDRALETVSIQKSKQLCDKPIASERIPFNDVKDEWDDLVLKSEVLLDGQWVEYQNGLVSNIISFEDIEAYLKKHDVELKNCIVFCGTVPLVDGFKYGDGFRCSLKSNKLDKEISLEYQVKYLKEN